MILQLDPQIPVYVVPTKDSVILAGTGMAIGWMDYGLEHSLIWIVAYNEGGAVWCVPNEMIRLSVNATAGRRAHA